MLTYRRSGILVARLRSDFGKGVLAPRAFSVDELLQADATVCFDERLISTQSPSTWHMWRSVGVTCRWECNILLISLAQGMSALQ